MRIKHFHLRSLHVYVAGVGFLLFGGRVALEQLKKPHNQANQISLVQVDNKVMQKDFEETKKIWKNGNKLKALTTYTGQLGLSLILFIAAWITAYLAERDANK